MTSEVNSSDWGSEIDEPTLMETIQRVKLKNEEFNSKFRRVSDMIRNYRSNEIDIKNSELAEFLDKLIEKRPEENHINLTMTVLDLIYINLSNRQPMYYFPENKDFLTNYDKLKDIEKRYKKLESAVNRPTQ